MWLVILLLVIFGLVDIIAPKTSWFISNWWKFQGSVMPSQASLKIYRFGGVLLLIAAVILMISTI